MRRSQVLWVIVLVACAAAACKGMLDLGRVLLLEARGAIDSDAHLYFIVGRGILNGLTPYADLFESKPPGMFLIAVLSLLVTGDERLALWLQLLIFLLIPLGLCLFAWEECIKSKQERRVRSLALIALAFLLGIQTSLFLEDRAGGIQSESFGTFAAFAYLFLLLRWQEHLPTKKHIALLSFLLLACIGTKEPFLLAVLAAALLVSRSRREFLHFFLLPLLCAGLMGFCVLLLMGLLGPYLSIYLPIMTYPRVDANPLEPHWVRTFAVGRIFGNITTYYTAPLFGYLLAVLWILSPVLRMRKTDLPSVILTIAQGLLTYRILLWGFLFLVAARAASFDLLLPEGFLPLTGLSYAVLLLILGALFSLQYRRGLLFPALSGTIALVLATAAVGTTIYANNHFAFAVPAYLALLFLALRFLCRESQQQHLAAAFTVLICALTIALTVSYRLSAHRLKEMHDRLGHRAQDLRPVAEKVDALLENCGVNRYYGFGTFHTLAFAKHSPLGPLPQPSFMRYIGEDHPLFQENRKRLLQEAKVVIVKEWDLGYDEANLAELFTREPPPCAKPLLPIPGFTMLFRKPL